MKCISLVSTIVLMILIGMGLLSYQQTQTNVPQDYLRIHIRANSNSEQDQLVKYAVKNEVVSAMIPLLCECDNKAQMIEVIEQNQTYITSIANQVLLKNGFSYDSHLQLKEEYFPTRSYEDTVLESGIYDAVILNLGTGNGNNWWCVVYPPLCFTNSGSNSTIVYKSKIVELIQNFFKK